MWLLFLCLALLPPPAEAAEAAEAGSNGTLIINQRGGYLAKFHVTFYDSVGGNLDEYDTGSLAVGKTRDFKIPKYTYRVHVYVDIAAGKKRHFDFYADETVVNEKSRIELTSTKTSLHPKFDVKFNNGWSEKKPEYSHEESIQFKSYFNADNPNMYFKATFYREDCQIGEKSVKLSNIGEYRGWTVVDSETIKIPNGTTSIKVEVIKEGTPIDSATFRYNPAKKSKDDIAIGLGYLDSGKFTPMRVICKNNWRFGSVEAGSNGTLSIRHKGWYNAKFYVIFYNDNWETLSEYATGCLEGLGTRNPRDIKIPKNTSHICVNMYVLSLYRSILKWNDYIDFGADGSAVNEDSRIELTSKGTDLYPDFDVKINNGWIVK